MSPLAKVYVASSWKNERQPEIVIHLRRVGFDVYDYRHPAPTQAGFAWERVDPHWREWSALDFRNALDHPIAQSGFQLDMKALSSADATVLVLPSGRSAHLELGFAAARGQRTYVLIEPDQFIPELMYLMATRICLDTQELTSALVADFPRIND